MSDRRLGVYICHCGGNISDVVDVEAVRAAVEGADHVVVARTTVFACSDAGQQEMIDDIQQHELDGLVVASCSPTLHQLTFRGMAMRAELNPYQYVHVNLREQDSWVHGDDLPGATDKAIRLVRGGIARAALTRPLQPTRIDTNPHVVVVGAGVAGLRAAVALSDLGLTVTLVERKERPGGALGQLGAVYPDGRPGKELISGLEQQIQDREGVTLLCSANVETRSGTVGDFRVGIRLADGGLLELEAGAIVVTTGFSSYQPSPQEYGRGAPGVVTLPELRQLLDKTDDGALSVEGREVESLAYIYCVGSREAEKGAEGHAHCSRYCCNAALHTAALVAQRSPGVEQYHLHKGIRSYGKHEALFEEACRTGSVFIKFDDDAPPTVTASDDQLTVDVVDLLTDRQPMQLAPDLVVLVTGMVPQQNDALTDLLKLPLGRDGFYNEIHPKLRPVETLVDGVFIAGTAQGPKDISESAASTLAAAAKVTALLKRGFVELSPLTAKVDVDRCTWCGECLAACPYGAIDKVIEGGREVARISPTLCKGGGSCLPVCPDNALQLEGYSDRNIEAMIDAYAEEVKR